MINPSFKKYFLISYVRTIVSKTKSIFQTYNIATITFKHINNLKRILSSKLKDKKSNETQSNIVLQI